MVINPAGSELPLKPIYQIRKILSQQGSSIVDSYTVESSGDRKRFLVHYQFKRWSVKNLATHVSRICMFRIGPKQHDVKWKPMLGVNKESPPFNLTIQRGSKNVALLRPFVKFVLEDSISWTFWNWLQDSYVPDEHFYSTLVTIQITKILVRAQTFNKKEIWFHFETSFSRASRKSLKIWPKITPMEFVSDTQIGCMMMIWKLNAMDKVFDRSAILVLETWKESTNLRVFLGTNSTQRWIQLLSFAKRRRF